MAQNYRAEFSISPADEFEWSGVYGYTPDDPRIFEKFGEMYAVIRMKAGSADLDLEKIAKIVIEELQHKYFDEGSFEDETSVLNRLEAASWKMKSKFDMILSREPEIVEKGIDVEIGAVVVHDSYLYALVIGESKIAILRDESLVDISKALIDRDMSGLFKSGSLQINKDDRIMLFTQKTTDLDNPDLYNLASILDLNLLAKFSKRIGSSLLLVASENLQWSEVVEDVEIQDSINNNDEEAEDEYKSEHKREIEEDLVNSTSEEPSDYVEEYVYSEEQTDKSYTNQQLEDDGYQIEESEVYKRKDRNNSKTSVEQEGDSYSQKIKRISQSFISKIRTIDVSFVVKIFNSIYKFISKYLSNVVNYFKNNQTTYVQVFRNLAKIAKNLWRKIKTSFVENIIGTRASKFRYKKQINRNRLALAIVTVVFILFTSIVIYRSNVESEKRRVAEEDSAKIVEFQNTLGTLENAINVLDPNSTEARTQRKSEIQVLETSLKVYKSKTQQPGTIDELLLNVENLKDDVLFRKRFSQPAIIADLGALYSESALTDMVYAAGSLFVSDEGRGLVYRIAPEISGSFVEHISGLVQPYILVVNVAGDIVVYDKNADASIGKFSTQESNSLVRFVGSALADIGTIAESSIYSGNDSLYEINRTHGQIFKRDRDGADYVRGGALYTSVTPPNWKTDQLLKNAVDIEATFDLYVLIAGEGLQRYLGGGANTLPSSTPEESLSSFRNIDFIDVQSLKQATALDVQDEYVVIADPVNRRVLLFTILSALDTKPLQLINQYVYSGSDSSTFTNIKEVEIQGQQIFVLDGNKVIKLDI